MSPIIITLALDHGSQALLNALRQRHFPPGRNFIDAHITLFHALDGSLHEEIIRDVTAVAGPTYQVTAIGPFSLGRGVAISVQSDRLMEMRAQLARRWTGMLTAQDRQGYRPHVTIQNKVTSFEAKTLMAALQPSFSPFTMLATGLSVWRYLDGPWSLISTVPFCPVAAEKGPTAIEP
jgi:2'-5' RNA ligase